MSMTRVDFELIAWSLARHSDYAVAHNLDAKQSRDFIIMGLADDIKARHPRFDSAKFCFKAGHRKELRKAEHEAIVKALEPTAEKLSRHLVDQELPL